MRNMEQSSEEYYSANDESFNVNNNSTNTTEIISTSQATTPTIITTLGARKQIAPADPNEPQKPLSAYALFFKDTVTNIRHQNPNCSFQELSRIVSSMWEVLDEETKNVYNKRNEEARIEYMHQMQLYMQKKQQEQPYELIDNNAATMQSKPAIFKINRPAETSTVPTAVTTTAQVQVLNMTSTPQQTNAIVAQEPTEPIQSTPTESVPAATDQICSRQNCNKPAIVNPDWEDEYCSNECVVIHCRNVFNAWVQSNLDAKAQHMNS